MDYSALTGACDSSDASSTGASVEPDWRLSPWLSSVISALIETIEAVEMSASSDDLPVLTALSSAFATASVEGASLAGLSTGIGSAAVTGAGASGCA